MRYEWNHQNYTNLVEIDYGFVFEVFCMLLSYDLRFNIRLLILVCSIFLLISVNFILTCYYLCPKHKNVYYF